MDSIPLEKAKLPEFGKNRTACYGKAMRMISRSRGSADIHKVSPYRWQCTCGMSLCTTQDASCRKKKDFVRVACSV